MKDYRDIDYDSFPVADLDLDMHWIQLSRAVLRERELARQATLEAQRIAEQPPDHQVILVPADATYAPKENELWPIINHTVQAALKPHEAAYADVMRAVHCAMDEYRGWKNPYPVSLEYPTKPITTNPRRWPWGDARRHLIFDNRPPPPLDPCLHAAPSSGEPDESASRHSRPSTNPRSPKNKISENEPGDLTQNK